MTTSIIVARRIKVKSRLYGKKLGRSLLWATCLLGLGNVINGCASIQVSNSDTVRISTLKIRVDSKPPGALVRFQFPNELASSPKDSIFHCPCELVVAYIDESTNSNGSKSGRMVIGGNFAFSVGGFCWYKARQFKYFDNSPTPRESPINPLCIPVHIELQGYSPIDTTVSFDKVADEIKDLNVIMNH